jgi:hypothetical protein
MTLGVAEVFTVVGCFRFLSMSLIQIIIPLLLTGRSHPDNIDS